MRILSAAVLISLSTSAAAQLGGFKAVSDKALAAVSGRENLQQIAEARNTSNVSGNRIEGVSTTGTIAIDGNAFQNMTGLSVLSVNSGNNVSINAAMNVNVALRP